MAEYTVVFSVSVVTDPESDHPAIAPLSSTDFSFKSLQQAQNRKPELLRNS
ncbi:hypothetical protein [[Limnothrix rosea] IAM M-220]|uniref:hypothetical protein n=1 Tax=[Limnothrix rosea] IAM M-220 TaxID=454133 RepID=UPI0015C54E45|nr:hypothetical protein [[Limnothrix rosea] IAM M-220]